MTVAPSPHPASRRRARSLAGLVVVASGLAAPALVAPPAAAAGAFWEVRWSAPVTTAGPNAFAGPPELEGTAAPPVVGNPTEVTYAVAVPAGYPAACAARGGPADLVGKAFTVKPVLPCNGTYQVSVVASGNAVPRTSPTLQAPVTLIDRGPAPGGLNGSVVDRQVTISWARDADPDVVGYRIRRDGRPVGDVAGNVGAHSDTVPGEGTYAYDVQALRWGAGGPGSPAIASPPSAALTAPVVDDAPPVDLGSGPGRGPGTGPAPGGSGGSAGAPGPGGTGSGTGSLPPSGTASPKVPRPGPTSGPSGTRSRFRSGGTIEPGSAGGSTGSAEPDTYAERLPYEPRATGRSVELAGPDTARTVTRTVSTPGRPEPGLLVPLAVGLVLLAGSVQIRAFLRRTAPQGLEVHPGTADG